MQFALWPYALRNAMLLYNSLPVLEEGTSRLELFSSIHVGCNMKHVHTFGCPVFVLQNTLTLGSQLPRWSPCAHLGLNLGPSPMHGRNVYLVLSLITRCVSHRSITVASTIFQGYTSQRTRYQWHHLLAAISEIESCRNDSFQGVSANAAQRYAQRDTI
jgi:hypothetical protein